MCIRDRDNILAFYNTDLGGVASGASWILNINYSDCPTQYVQSDGFCTSTLYAGNAAGPPPVTYPPGWNTYGFADTGWVGAYSAANPGIYSWMTFTDPS